MVAAVQDVRTRGESSATHHTRCLVWDDDSLFVAYLLCAWGRTRDGDVPWLLLCAAPSAMCPHFQPIVEGWYAWFAVYTRRVASGTGASPLVAMHALRECDALGFALRVAGGGCTLCVGLEKFAAVCGCVVWGVPPSSTSLLCQTLTFPCA